MDGLEIEAKHRKHGRAEGEELRTKSRLQKCSPPLSIALWLRHTEFFAAMERGRG